MKHPIRRACLAIPLFVLACATHLVNPAAVPPNFIIVFADDLGYGDLGCFGSKVIATPNIDRMAAEGMRFTDFYVAAPLCTPSRAALLTGCYPERVGLGEFVLRPDSRRGLHPDEITLAELLKTRGYATGCIGKWHLGFLPPFRPTSQGFDFYFGLYHNLDEPEAAHFVGRGGVPLLRMDDVAERPADKNLLVRKYTREAVGFIRKNRNRPFFLYFPHTMPHVPLGASPEFRGKSKGGLYGDVVAEIDWSTGELLRTLRELDLERRTFVVFTSDNGPSGRATGSALPLRGRKNTTFEGGMRVPCVMWAPGRIPQGTTCSEVATSMDFYPTFARMAGAAVPADRVIDGRDIGPLMRGEPGAASPHAAFFYHNGRAKLEAVRAGRWKLLQRRGRTLLYDLDADIAESKNLARERPEKVSELTRLMEDFERRFARTSRPVGER